MEGGREPEEECSRRKCLEQRLSDEEGEEGSLQATVKTLVSTQDERQSGCRVLNKGMT